MNRLTYLFLCLFLFFLSALYCHGQQIPSIKKPSGISFPVNNVVKATVKLKSDSTISVFEAKAARKILFIPEESRKSFLISCENNGLIQTIQECFDNHRPLILTPDVIWLAICQGVSVHINLHFDSLKHNLFLKDKPDELLVRNDSLTYNARAWEQLIASFSAETRLYTSSDNYAFFVPSFSTTGEIEKTAYQVTMLESYKKGFRYIAESGCGIPSITLKGTRQDWESILFRINKLQAFGLGSWAESLHPIMKKFIEVFDNEIDTEFWKDIYKNADEYNAFYTSGWIINFFPYIKTEGAGGEYNDTLMASAYEEQFKPNPFLGGSKYLLSTLATDNFPSGLAKVPVTWVNYTSNVTSEMEILAGFFGIRQYDDFSLEPYISWAVCNREIIAATHKLNKKSPLSLQHPNNPWSPHICAKPLSPAIYEIRQFKTQEAGLRFIQSRIEEAVQRHAAYKNRLPGKVSVEFLVLSDGSVTGIDVKGDGNPKALKEIIEAQIRQLPGTWFPALAHPQDVLDLMDVDDHLTALKIRVNSRVKIDLFAH